jgi:AAA+ superfamily predicted ATPase
MSMSNKKKKITQDISESPLAKLIEQVTTQITEPTEDSVFAPARYQQIAVLSDSSTNQPTNTLTNLPKKVKPNMDRRTTARVEEVRFRDLIEGDELRHHTGLLGTVMTHPRDDNYWLIRDQNGVDQEAQAKDSQALLKNVKWQLVIKFLKGNVDFDTVILAKDKKQQIIDAISQVDNHKLIFEDWGFNEVFEKGTAISLLFYGPPGTGKTLMAQAIADRYGRKLRLVSTAEIETPEPGGAERNLKKYFEEAQQDNAVLLFDECDSLITDRSRVGMILAAQINALLTELERYTGIVIFTTNRLGALDPAFDRRLSLKLEFPMPDAKHRVAIWQRMFPKKAPLAKDIRWEDLAEVPIAGGHIKNVVLKAARKAAAAGLKEITDDILWDCLEKEVESLESYKDALNSHNPFMGRPLPGQGRSLSMSRAYGRRDITRG